MFWECKKCVCLFVDWYTACQAVGVLGLATATLALCLLVFWICTHRNSLWVKATIIALIIVTCEYYFSVADLGFLRLKGIISFIGRFLKKYKGFKM